MQGADMDFGLGDVPILGDIYNAARGNPNEIKAAYDAQIKASQQQAAQMQQFLMGAKGQAQQFYGPIQHMFQQAYGTEGLQAPQTPQGTAGMGPLSRMYGGR
jgi:hypothetical protein